MDFVAQLKSMVTVLDQGSLLCEGEMAAVQANPKVIEVYLGR
jgi:urea transport system ATP-binding protein